MAAQIPKDLIKPDDKFIDLEIDMNNSDHNLYIREVGTHDYI
jgi:hypothetical protein